MAGPIFISLEGGDGSGKSTQANLLHQRLREAGVRAALIHEPGSTPLGEYLRDYLKSKQPLSPEAELLLFEAARTQLVRDVIQPNLANGITVVTDRFEASSMAYQGYGRGIALDIVERFNAFAVQGLTPDLTFLLDIDPSEGLRRVGDPQMALPLGEEINAPVGRQDVEEERRFEDAPIQFHRRVREGFLAQAAGNPKRWVVIDAGQSVERVHEQLWGVTLERLG